MTRHTIILGCILVFCSFFCVKDVSASVFSKTSTASSSLNNGLVGWYTLDGKDTLWNSNKVIDRSGYGNYGTITNMSTSTPAIGKIGQALQFDGTNDYITVPESSSNNVTGNEISFGAWVFPTYSGNYQMIIGKPLNSTSRQYAIYLTSGNTSQVYIALSGVSGAAGTGTNFTLSSPWVVNQWNHIFVTYKNGVGGFVYLNGNSVCTNCSWSGSITNVVGSAVNIGAEGIDNFFYTQGKIDDARIYNRALSANEIQRLYRLGSTVIGGRFSTTTNSVFMPNGLVAYYPFDGKTVSWNTRKASDMSGNGNTLSILTVATSSAIVPGKIGQALNTRSSEFSATDANSLDLTSASMFAWIKRNSDTAGYETIISKRVSNLANYEIDIDTTAGASKKIIFYNGSTVSTCGSTIPVGSWQFVGVTVTGSSGVCYLNGVRDGTFSAALGATNAGSLGVGVNPGGSQYLLADIDEVRVYNRALSDDEVVKLYNFGAGTVGKTPTTQTSGLVGWYTFDGKDVSWNTNKIVDKSGTGNTGTITNMSTSSAPVMGRIGQGFRFDGVDDYIELGSNVLSGTTANFSFGGWYRTTASGYSNRAMGDADSTGGTSGIDFIPGATGATRLDFVRRGGTCTAAGDLAITASGATDGAWHHIFYASNASTYNVYFDGVSVSSGSSCTVNHGLPFRIGRDGNGTDKFNGSLDDVRIYNRGLSASEVQALYNMGR